MVFALNVSNVSVLFRVGYYLNFYFYKVDRLEIKLVETVTSFWSGKKCDSYVIISLMKRSKTNALLHSSHKVTTTKHLDFMLQSLQGNMELLIHFKIINGIYVDLVATDGQKY